MHEPVARRHLALIGLSGVGKSSIGRRAAASLDVGFVDLDDEITKTAGMPPAEMFTEHGEAAFRDLETQTLAHTLARPDAVLIATGGGVVLRDANREALIDQATSLWLRASVDTLLPRLARNYKRPLLAGDAPEVKLEAMIHDRYPLYEKVANEVLDVDGLSFQQVVTCVVELLR